MTYRLAAEKDLDGIMVMVRRIIERPGTAWDDEYPRREHFEGTLKREGLYVAEENGRIVGTVGIEPAEDIFESLECWSPAVKPGEGVRFGIDPEYQGEHLAIPFMCFCMNDASSRLGYDMLRFTAAKENRRANAVYTYMGIDRVGETNRIDISWWCYEARLPLVVDGETMRLIKQS
ncbi:MAG: GNAT family N-acetyltransferase [Clostridia bacterium]|nr:GNAT family N-acetyltransferase [Clostridia bacterium]